MTVNSLLCYQTLRETLMRSFRSAIGRTLLLRSQEGDLFAGDDRPSMLTFRKVGHHHIYEKCSSIGNVMELLCNNWMVSTSN